MKCITVTDYLSVSEQISVADLKAIKSAGFKSLICNRPDGEEAGQTAHCEIEQVAEKIGLHCTYFPVISGKIQPCEVTAFKKQIEECEKPILAYCRTGTRCMSLWAMANLEEVGIDKVLSVAERAGFNLSQIINNYLEMAER